MKALRATVRGVGDDRVKGESQEQAFPTSHSSLLPEQQSGACCGLDLQSH